MSTADTAASALSRAQAMIDVKHYAQASALLAQLLATDPSGPGWCLMAAARLGEADDAGALEAANQAVALSPEDGWPHRLASSALLNLGHYPESLRAALEAQRLEPGQWQSHAAVAHAAVRAPNLQLAANGAREALRLAPEEPDVLCMAARVAMAQSDWVRAEAHLQKALALDPAHSVALNELGKMALEGHHPVKAVRLFARAAATAPEIPAYAGNVELAVIRSAALVVYVLAAAGAAVVMVCTGLRLPLALTLTPLVGAWIIAGCLLALAGWRVPAATRQVISRLIRRRHVAIPVAVIAAGAAAAVLAIVVIINVITGPAPTSITIPLFSPLLILVATRLAAVTIWREHYQTRQKKASPAAPSR